MIKQIGLPLCGRPILLLTRMITDRIGLYSVLLPLLTAIHCTYYILPKNFLQFLVFGSPWLLLLKVSTQQICQISCFPALSFNNLTQGQHFN